MYSLMDLESQQVLYVEDNSIHSFETDRCLSDYLQVIANPQTKENPNQLNASNLSDRLLQQNYPSERLFEEPVFSLPQLDSVAISQNLIHPMTQTIPTPPVGNQPEALHQFEITIITEERVDPPRNQRPRPDKGMPKKIYFLAKSLLRNQQCPQCVRHYFKQLPEKQHVSYIDFAEIYDYAIYVGEKNEFVEYWINTVAPAVFQTAKKRHSQEISLFQQCLQRISDAYAKRVQDGVELLRFLHKTPGHTKQSQDKLSQRTAKFR